MTSILAFLAIAGSSFAADHASDVPMNIVDADNGKTVSSELNRCQSQRCRPSTRSTARPVKRTTTRSTRVNRPVRSQPSVRTTTHRAQSQTRRVSASTRTVVRTQSSYRPRRTTTVNVQASVTTRPLAITRTQAQRQGRATRTHRPVLRPRTVVRPSRPAVRHSVGVRTYRPSVRHVTVAPRYRYRPYHGVFVYGPSVRHHHHYRGSDNTVEVQEKHLPTRKVNRKDTWAIGVRSGSYLTAYDGSRPYGDFGLGLTARYRPFEALGIEGAIMHHDQTWDDFTERSQTIGQASVMVFANPWGKISPYALGGLSANARDIQDVFRVDNGDMNGLDTQDVLWGPHAGVGVEIAFGKRVALDLEARYTAYLNTDRDDPTLPGALQTSAGFLVHF